VSAARGLNLQADGADAQQGRTPRSQGPEATATTRSRSGIVIGRYQATVVVTVHGELDHPRAAHLGHVLADLIDGQGNLSLLVDLHDANAADARHLAVFAVAAERVLRHGGSIALSKSPDALREALRQNGLGHLVEAVVQHGAERAPAAAAEGSSRRERQAHPATTSENRT
jgi:anti-anti-sigma factor